jgi:hypothetical protein
MRQASRDVTDNGVYRLRTLRADLEPAIHAFGLRGGSETRCKEI